MNAFQHRHAWGDVLTIKISNQIETILAGSTCTCNLALDEMLKFTSTQKFNGIAVAKDDERAFYLAFLSGEPEGVVYVDERETFYGDKAAKLLPDGITFVLHALTAEIVAWFVMGCRLFEKSLIKTHAVNQIPRIGMTSTGIGVLTLTLMHGNAPWNGVRVSIRKDGLIMGSDITTDTGSCGFRLMYGDYTCIVEDRLHSVKLFDIRFDRTHGHIVLNLPE